MKRALPLFAITLVLVDAVMAALAFYFSYLYRYLQQGPLIGPVSSYWLLAVVQVFSTLLVFFFYKFYHRRSMHTIVDEFYRVFGAVSVATLVTVASISLAMRDTLDYPRSMIMLTWGFSLVTITIGRFAHRRWQLWMQRKRHIGLIRLLIVGTGEMARMILQRVEHTPTLGYHVVGFVDVAAGPETLLGLPVLGRVGNLPKIIEAHGVQEVILALPEASHQELVGIISYCEREKVTIRVLPDIFQIMASEVTIDDLGGLPLLTIRDVALRGWKLTLKRFVDVIVSGASLLILSPVMMLTAIIVKLDSRGPAFFIQERMGLDAKPFPMIKFRSMRQDAESKGPGWTTKEDPRRTRIGTFIRRYSFDELPQLINVLMGDMSMVGPRPEQPAYVAQFQQSIPRYMDRHREKAGITGWAQVNGLRGDTSISERTKYDLWYIENWSLWLDFKILMLTAYRVFGDRNAY